MDCNVFPRLCNKGSHIMKEDGEKEKGTITMTIFQRKKVPHIICQNASMYIWCGTQPRDTVKHELNPFSAWREIKKKAYLVDLILNWAKVWAMECNDGNLWCGRRYWTSKGSTVMVVKLVLEGSWWESWGCQSTKGSIPGGKDGLSSSETGTWTWDSVTGAGLGIGEEEPQGTNLLRAESLRVRSWL